MQTLHREADSRIEPGTSCRGATVLITNPPTNKVKSGFVGGPTQYQGGDNTVMLK